MNILKIIKNKEYEGYKDMKTFIKKRMKQIKETQIMREANNDLANLKPAKVIFLCIVCGEAKVFFKGEVLKICDKCWKAIIHGEEV